MTCRMEGVVGVMSCESFASDLPCASQLGGTTDIFGTLDKLLTKQSHALCPHIGKDAPSISVHLVNHSQLQLATTGG